MPIENCGCDVEEFAVGSPRMVSEERERAPLIDTVSFHQYSLSPLGDRAPRKCTFQVAVLDKPAECDLHYLLSLVARCAIEHEDTERAGRLWGAIETEEARAPMGQWEIEREAYAAPLLRRAGAGFERGRALGRTLSLDEVVKQALDER